MAPPDPSSLGNYGTDGESEMACGVSTATWAARYPRPSPVLRRAPWACASLDSREWRGGHRIGRVSRAVFDAESSVEALNSVDTPHPSVAP